MKGEQIGRKVREIKFPQYIMNEKFEKMKINFMFLFLEFGYFIWFFSSFFLIKNRERVFILFNKEMGAL